MQTYLPEIEKVMQKYYATLNEKVDAATQQWKR